MMVLSLTSIPSTNPSFLGSRNTSSDLLYYRCNWLNIRYSKSSCYRIQRNKQRCECKSEELEEAGRGEERVKGGGGGGGSKLEIGSPVIVIEAPLFLKTAASVPCLRANSGLVKPGDVGRIMSRKPKDVWAVRLSIGTYLIDAKYFKPLDLD